jgi:hypothetical protein
MAYPTFAELAHRLVDAAVYRDDRAEVGRVAGAFHELIDGVADVVPSGPDATHAARDIHRACQSVITSITLNQE